MSELIIELTASQVKNNNILSLVDAALYDYFTSNGARKNREVYDLFYDLSCGIEKLAPKIEGYEPSDRLEELRELFQTFKIKKYFIDILDSLGLSRVKLKYPVMLVDDNNGRYVHDYLEGVFEISN